MPTSQAGFGAWIPVEYSPDVIQRVNQNSAVIANGQNVPMVSESRSTPRSGGVTLGTINKGGDYGVDTRTHDAVWLFCSKFGGAVAIAEEDLNDSLADIVNAKTTDAATSFAKNFDNACLGVTAVKDGAANQFNSLYYTLTQADAGTGYTANANISTAATSGAPTYAELSAALGKLEQGDFYSDGDVVIIAHPSLKQVLRGIVDLQGRPIFNESTAGFPGGGQGGTPTLFGHQLQWSLGSRQSAAPTESPTGKPLVVFANKQYLLVGNRFPLSVQSIDGNTGLGALTDTAYLKFQARKAFAVGAPQAASILVA